MLFLRGYCLFNLLYGLLCMDQLRSATQEQRMNGSTALLGEPLYPTSSSSSSSSTIIASPASPGKALAGVTDFNTLVADRQSKFIDPLSNRASFDGYGSGNESKTQRFLTWLFFHQLHLTVLFQGCFVALLYAVDSNTFFDEDKKLPLGLIVLICMVQGVKFVLLCLATFQLITHMGQSTARPHSVWKMYLSTIIDFAGVYGACYCASQQSFSLPDSSIGDVTHRDEQLYQIFFWFFYYSVTVTTTSGLGDIYPLLLVPQAITCLQMTVAIAYTVGFFGVGLHHFQRQRQFAVERSSRRFGLEVGAKRGRIRMFFKWMRTNIPGLERVRRFCIKYVLGVSILFQAICMSMLFNVDASLFEVDTSSKKNLIGVLLGLTIVQFLFVFLLSIRLVNKVRGDGVDALFLVQSWLSTVLVFGTIYFCLYLLGGKHYFLLPNIDNMPGFQSVPRVLWLFFYFSMEVQTTTCFGDIAPIHVVSRAVVILQMLESVLYTMVVLGVGISRLLQKMDEYDLIIDTEVSRRSSLVSSPPRAVTSPPPLDSAAADRGSFQVIDGIALRRLLFCWLLLK